MGNDNKISNQSSDTTNYTTVNNNKQTLVAYCLRIELNGFLKQKSVTIRLGINLLQSRTKNTSVN